MNAIKEYYDDCLRELHLVRWPTRQQAIRLSIIVLSFTAVATAALGWTDFVLSEVVTFLLSII